MKLGSLMQEVANEINAQYSEYDETKSVVIVRFESGRLQTIYGTLEAGEKFNNRRGIQLKSKVCEVPENLDYRVLLEETARVSHAKFVIEDNYLQVEASVYEEAVNKELLKEMILEVTELADKWENELTGQDIN